MIDIGALYVAGGVLMGYALGTFGVRSRMDALDDERARIADERVRLDAERAELVDLMLDREREKSHAAASLTEERKRLDAERIASGDLILALRDVLVARDAREAVELERGHAEADRVREPPTPPPAWRRDPRVTAHVAAGGHIKERPDRGTIQLCIGTPGNVSCREEIPISALGEAEVETFTPSNPMR